MSKTTALKTCHCWICRGREILPASAGKPARYHHELPAETIEGEPILAPERTAIRKIRVVHVPDTRTLEERIATIQARTDIGSAMKAMQITNLRKKHENH